MRILVLISGMTAHGGIERYNCALIEELRALSSVPDGVYVLSLNDPKGVASYLGFDRQQKRFVRIALMTAWRDRPEIIVLSHVNFSPLAMAFRVVCPHVRVYCIAHGVEVERRRDLLTLLGLHAATGIRCVSQSTRSLVERAQHMPPHKTHVVHYGVEPVQFPCRVRETGKDKGLRLLTVSRLDSRESYKGIAESIQAVGRLRSSFDITFAIAGGGDDRTRLEELAYDLGLGDCVQFLGRVSDERLHRLFDESDIFVLPSTGEGLGIVYLEAMIWSLPVVAVRAGGVGDAVVHEANGPLVRTQEPVEIACAIARLASDSVLRARLGRFGREVTSPAVSRSSMRADLCQALRCEPAVACNPPNLQSDPRDRGRSEMSTSCRSFEATTAELILTCSGEN